MATKPAGMSGDTLNKKFMEMPPKKSLYHSIPYGKVWVNERAAEENHVLLYKYTGKEYDPETKLTYYGARYYDAKLSRWISVDPPLISGEYLGNDPSKLPSMGGVFNPINLNGYQYAGANPVKYVDPTGEDTVLLFNGSVPSEGEGDMPNPFGHSAIAFTGKGVYSYGTGTAEGSSLKDFMIKQQNPRRDSVLIVIKTTPKQEQKMIQYLKKMKSQEMGIVKNNCAQKTHGALSEAGIISKLDGISPLPVNTQIIGESIKLFKGGQKYEFKKGSGSEIYPIQLYEFEPDK